MTYRTVGFKKTNAAVTDGYDTFEDLSDMSSTILSEHPDSLAQAIVDVQQSIADGYVFTTTLPRSTQTGITWTDGHGLVYNASQTKMVLSSGPVVTSGSANVWTLGSSSGTTGTHIIRGQNTSNFILEVRNNNTAAGQSSGMTIYAGTNASDSPLSIVNATNTANLGNCTGVGAWTLGDASNASFPGNNIVGRKDGSSVPTGHIGEVLEATTAVATAFSSNIANGGYSFGAATQTVPQLIYATGSTGDAAAKLPVPKGTWRIEGGVRWDAGVNAFSEVQFFLFNSPAASDGPSAPYSATFRLKPDSGTSANAQGGVSYHTLTTNLNSPTTYYLYMNFVGSAASLSLSSCWIRATRIG
jgi:hypothetical protein